MPLKFYLDILSNDLSCFSLDFELYSSKSDSPLIIIVCIQSLKTLERSIKSPKTKSVLYLIFIKGGVTYITFAEFKL